MSYDYTALSTAVRDLAEAQRALTWFEDFGESLTRDDVKVDVEWMAATACTGAAEAASLVAKRLENGIQRAIAEAIEDRRNTIGMLRSRILGLLDAKSD